MKNGNEELEILPRDTLFLQRHNGQIISNLYLKNMADNKKFIVSVYFCQSD
jgi:hypothetical protein